MRKVHFFIVIVFVITSYYGVLVSKDSSNQVISSFDAKESCILQCDKQKCTPLSRLCSCKLPPVYEVNGIVNRKAELKDLEKISALYDAMTTKDRENLVVVPRSLRAQWLTKYIQRGAFYVAETDKGIIGFVKVFVVTERSELDQLLYEELHCCGSQRQLREAKNYKIPVWDVGTFNPLYSEKLNEEFILRVPGQTFIYYGSSYVVPEERARSVGTELKNFAFESVFFDVLTHVVQNKSTEIVLLYGQVPVNIKHESMFRSFLLLLKSVFLHLHKTNRFLNDPYFRLSYYAYRSHKPILKKNKKDGSLIEKHVPREHWQDYGCVISCLLL